MLPNIRKKGNAVFGLIVVAAIWTGCISREEGCLDIEADNFDLNAERDCQGCCTYPSMTLTLTQKWGDSNFSVADTLYDAEQQPYRLIDLKYLLTSWSWKSESGIVFTVDSVNAACGSQEKLRFTPDVLLIDANQFVYTLGDVRQAQPIREMQMIWGSLVDYSCLDPEDPNTPAPVKNTSPLWDDASTTLQTMRLIIQKDLNADDFDTVFIPASIDVPILLQGLTTDMVRGQNTNLRLTADYQDWCRDARLDDLATFRTSIIDRVTFSLTP